MDDDIRIGLLADTHMPGSRERLWPQLEAAFAGVDAILHAGDLHTGDVIDTLGSIAPTWVARGNGDMDVEHPRLRDEWLLEFGGVRVGMVHEFPHPGRASDAKVAKRLQRHFPAQRPQVIVFGHTHHESIHAREDILYINPGSPMLPRNQSTRLGTIALLTIRGGAVTAQLHQLTDSGTRLIAPLEA